MKQFGNVLGDSRAENDKLMLEEAFVETSDYHALIHTSDFNFIVGRRGTGKSALFIKTFDFFYKQKNVRVLRITPEEYECIALSALLQKTTDNYTKARPATKIAWHLSLLIEIAIDLCNHYKTKRCSKSDFIYNYIETNSHLCKISAVERVTEIIKSTNSGHSIEEIPALIAKKYEFKQLRQCINDVISYINKKIIVMLDKLDEGWRPEQIPASIVGGLAIAASSISESSSNIHIYAYVRDNIFRVLSYLDKDFSRDIESSTLRLTWNTDSLFNLITSRIALANGITTANTSKIWNRFAHRDLSGRRGFEYCLGFTLFRPRDIITLLNLALHKTMRANRNQLIETDVENSAKEISDVRLQDLVKEYDQVLPGLELLVKYYKSHNALFTFEQALESADNFLYSNKYMLQEESDFAIFNTNQEIFKSLYSVGFLGIEYTSGSGFQFSFDGAPVKVEEIQPDTSICIHPCYWPALAISPEGFDKNSVIKIHDDYYPEPSLEIAKTRTQIVGQLITQLPPLSLGQEGASGFEKWCLRAIQILFSGKLVNPELHPNSNSVQRRDIVATNMAANGFWKTIKDDFNSREVIFEIKNFEKLKIENYRQALSYSDDATYGRFIILIHRGGDGVEKQERKWIKEFYYKHKVLIFSLPANLLANSISKLRSKQRFDYIENKLIKRLGTYRRKYISI